MSKRTLGSDQHAPVIQMISERHRVISSQFEYDDFDDDIMKNSSSDVVYCFVYKAGSHFLSMEEV